MQWRNPSIASEMIALGLETPEQLGSMFIADAKFLGELTADVAPVTDNFPSRLSSRPTRSSSFIPLYDMLMDEGERLKRFSSSALISQWWPEDLKTDSESFFQYERMLKNYFSGGIYKRPTDPYRWDDIDELLTNTALTTLPLWLLGSDQTTQEIVARRLDEDGFQDAFALELARKHTVERDYETALEYVTNHIAASSEVSDRVLYFYLYLLAKNNRMTEARNAIGSLDVRGQPRARRFADWFIAEFDTQDNR